MHQIRNHGASIDIIRQSLIALAACARREIADDERALLHAAASVEDASEHAIGRAIVAAARTRGLEPSPVEDFVSVPGRGARARVPASARPACMV